MSDSCLYPFCGITKGRTIYIRVTFDSDTGKKRSFKAVGIMCNLHLERVIKQLKMVPEPDNQTEKHIQLEKDLYDHNEE